MSTEPGGAGFVGREHELGRLCAAWERARRGEAVIAGIEGDPGIGKTALVRRFTELAAPRARVWVSGDEVEAGLPWGVLAQLHRALGGTPRGAGPWDPRADPLFVGQDLARTLQDGGELLVVVDDAHWADHSSMAALRVAARRLLADPVMIVVVHGTGGGVTGVAPPPTYGVGDGWRRLFEADGGLRLRLGGLPAGELARLAVACGRPGLSPAGAARLHAHTGGHPLHVRHLLDELPLHSIVFGHGPLPAPERVAAAVSSRLGACAEATRELVAAGAVLGRRFSLAGVRDMTPATPATPATAATATAAAPAARVADAVAEAISAGLLEEVPGSGGQELAFTGALSRGVVYHGLECRHRRELHRRAAARGGSAALWHRIAAADGPDERLAADVEREASGHLTRGEITLAAARLRQALDLTPHGPGRTPRLIAAMEALLVAGDLATSLDYQGELAAAPPGAWRDYVAGYQLLLAGRVPEARSTLLRALDTLGTSGAGRTDAGPPDLRARIAAQLAIISVLTVSCPEMIEYGRMAVAAAGEPWVAAFGCFARSLGLAVAGRSGEALESLAGADAPGAPGGLDGLVARGMIRLWADDLDGAGRDLALAVERATRGEALRIGQALGFLGEVEYRRGALGEAVLHTELAVGDAEENDRVWDYPMLHALAGYPLAARGEWERALWHAERATANARLVGTPAALSYAAACRVALAQARGQAAWLLDAAGEVDGFYPSPEPGTHLLGPLRADALSRLGRPDEAGEALDAFVAALGKTGRRSAWLGVARVRAQIALARGDHREALGHCRQAASLAREAGLRLEAARVDLLAGACQAAAGRRAAAERALRAALGEFARMGATAYVAQTLEVAGAAGLSLDAPPAALGVLTPAERAVVTLVCRGLTNREIADALVVSRKTVEFHLTNVFRRLDVTTRTELREVLGTP